MVFISISSRQANIRERSRPFGSDEGHVCTFGEAADLIVRPSSEGFLSAYPWRYVFDTTIGSREPRGKQLIHREA